VPTAPGRYFAGRRWVRIADPLGGGARERGDVLCLPLLVGERRLGVIRLVGCAPRHTAGGREMPRLRAVAGLLAQAVERDRLAREATDAEVLRRADQTKSALLSSVSHDLRTPLASIKASATSLLDEEVDWGRAARRELLLAIDEEADRLTRFVSRLLDLSRVEAGAAQPLKDWHAVDELLDGVAERLDPGGARVRLDVPDELPLARLDYVMVQQIVSNLVENALKYSAPEAAVVVGAEVRDGQLRIDVADRGPGVPPAERERIFEKFYRARERATRAPGTGIGLAVARGLAQAHGGELRYAPRPDGGSVFSLSLPLETDVREPAVR
jgi:two-component system sensor histidine kinase KdpD